MREKFFYRSYAKLFARNFFQPVHRVLFRLSIRGMGVMNYYDWKISGEKYFIYNFLRKYHIKTVFDVGANEGDYTKMLLDLYNCNVYCFEPSPKAFEILSRRFFDNPRVKMINSGLSDEVTDSILYDYQDSKITSHGSLYKESITQSHKQQAKSYNIALTTLDIMVDKYNIDKIDLLKIDTEGHEFSVLKGAERPISKGMIDIIQFEFNEFNTYSRVFFNDYVEYLKDYSLFRLLPRGLLPLDGIKPIESEIFGFQNIIAIRKMLKN